MAEISNVTVDRLAALRQEVEKVVNRRTSLEEAAQAFIGLMYDEFKESIVLARLFATVPFKDLPAPNQRFVSTLTTAHGIQHLLSDQTLVLSLLGSRGQETAWNNRRNSQGHVGIPLASADFIDKIPMMSRLLKQVGLGLDWIDSQDTDIVTRSIGKMGGVFYVPEAQTTVDHQGRLIIAAQDFVRQYGVRTVFGFGGGYITKATFITNIIFTRERLAKGLVRQFLPFVIEFKAATMPLVSAGKIFSG